VNIKTDRRDFYQSPKQIFLGTFAKLRKSAISIVMSVCPSVCPHGTTRLPLNGFSRNLIFECFRKTVKKVQIFIQIGQEKLVLYVIVSQPL